MAPTLWAISDLHTGHTGNKPVTESLYPSTPDDWLIVAGDVAERTDDIRWSLDLLRRRFAKVIWVPGNHELWTTGKDPMQVFGRARYDYLVEMCDEMGIVTPEHPFPVWTDRAARPPSCRCSCSTTTRSCRDGRDDQGRGSGDRQGAQRGRHRRVPAVLRAVRHPRRVVPGSADLHPGPAGGAGLDDADGAGEPLPAARASRATCCSTRSSRCGAARSATADWHTRYNAVCSVYGHLHIPRTTWYDGVRFEEVSVGYPREWHRRKPYRWLRQVLPDPQYAPGYLNEFGGHFVITPEMREQSEKFRERLTQPARMSELMRAVLPDARRSGLRRAVPRPAGSGAAAGGGATDRAARWPSGATSSSPCGTARGWRWSSSGCRRRRSSRGRRANRAGPTVVVGQPDPLRGLPRCGGRPARGGPLGGYRRRTARRAARRCARRDQPAGRTTTRSAPCRAGCTGTGSCSAPRRRRTRRGSR